MRVTITLTPELEAALTAQVAGGDFASIEEAVRRILEAALFARELESTDLSWMKPLIEEGEVSGDPIPLEEVRRRTRKLLAELGAS